MPLPEKTKVSVLTRRGDFADEGEGYWLCYSYYDDKGIYRNEVMPCYVPDRELWEFLKPYTRPLRKRSYVRRRR